MEQNESSKPKIKVTDFLVPTTEGYQLVEKYFEESYGAERGKQRWREENLFLKQSIDTNPKLLEVDALSLGTALRALAVKKLTLDKAVGECYILPRSEKKGDGWVSKAHLQLGYKHTIDQITVDAGMEILGNELIYKGEHYKIELGKVVEHDMDIELRSKATKNDIIAGYMIAKTSNGNEVHTISYPKDIEYSKKTSQKKEGDLYNDKIEIAYYRCNANKLVRMISKKPIDLTPPPPQNPTPPKTEDVINLFDNE